MRNRIMLFILPVTILVWGICPFVGMDFISPAVLWQGQGIDFEILTGLRLPRCLLAFAAGAILSLGGLAFQAVFRNPLATPYTLGISSGAAVGAVVAIYTGFVFSVFYISGITLLSVGSALLTVGIVYGLAHMQRGLSGGVLLLAGVSMNYIFASLILLLQFVGSEHDTYQVVRWLMGSLTGAGYVEAMVLWGGMLLLLGMLYVLRNQLDIFLTGEDLATARGVDVKRLKRRLYFSVSIMVGLCVAFCGPIGFVGIIVPHIGRRIFSPMHQRLVVPTALLGGGLLTVCDTLARTVAAPAEVPVGILTSLVGGPFFLYILISKTKRGGML